MMKNGTIWLDNKGNKIHAHGGWIAKFGDIFYWYGENRIDEKYVSCYSSDDLINWEFKGDLLTTTTFCEPLHHTKNAILTNSKGNKINIERPKMIYNEKSKKYILWAHYENGEDYHDAAIALATSDFPDRDFIFHGYFNPYGYMSRDCTLFKEKDGTAYFISAARDNADLHIYRLSDDYLNVEKCINKLFVDNYREAPALIKWNNKYILMTSGCSSWNPNQAKYSLSDSMEGNWSDLTNVGDETTYYSQPAFILEHQGKLLYYGDRWGGDGEKYFDSSYVIYPLELNGNQLILSEIEEAEQLLH